MNIDNFDRLSLQHCYKLLLNFSKVEFKLKRKADNLQFKIWYLSCPFDRYYCEWMWI